MKITTTLLFPALVLSQTPLRNVSGSLCSLQIRDRSTSSLLERTNDWTIAPDSSETLWPTAHFLLSQNSTIYGANGELCSFSPYFNCKTQTTSARTTTLSIQQNSSITLDGSSAFWYCPDPDGDAHHAVPAPLIYPPKGFLDENNEPDYTSCNITSFYTDTCRDESDFKVNPQSVVLNSDPSTQSSQTAGVSRTTWNLSSLAFMVLAGLL